MGYRPRPVVVVYRPRGARVTGEEPNMEPGLIIDKHQFKACPICGTFYPSKPRVKRCYRRCIDRHNRLAQAGANSIRLRVEMTKAARHYEAQY